MNAIRPNRASFTLSVDDKCRLQKLAPFFGIRFRAVDEETYVIRVPGKQSSVDVSLPSAIAHRRLIAEICTRSAKWVHFHFGESCRDSLLGQTDARLRRVAELYTLDIEGAESS